MGKTRTPTFSIIIPAHNAADRIRRALDSIKSQTDTDFELIVVCDKCEDSTKDIAKGYRAKTLDVEFGNSGLAENIGLDAATGEWVLFLDDDDWWLHDRVIKTVRENLSDDIDMLFFGFEWKGYGLTVQGERNRYCAPWNKCYRRGFIGETRFTDRKYGADADFYQALLEKKPRCKYIPEILYYYNYMRPGSMTYRWKRGELRE